MSLGKRGNNSKCGVEFKWGTSGKLCNCDRPDIPHPKD